MTIPEFEIVYEFTPSFGCNGILLYKKYFILYSCAFIEIYNSENYTKFKEINIALVLSLSKLKEEYLIGLTKESVCYEITNLTLFKINI